MAKLNAAPTQQYMPEGRNHSFVHYWSQLLQPQCLLGTNWVGPHSMASETYVSYLLQHMARNSARDVIQSKKVMFD